MPRRPPDDEGDPEAPTAVGRSSAASGDRPARDSTVAARDTVASMRTAPPQPAEEPDILLVPTNPAIQLAKTQRVNAAARVAAERRTLTLLTGPTAGQVFVLTLPEHLLGRGEVADIQVTDVDVSRRHARIFRDPDGTTMVEDLDSTNGTFVGGARVEAPRALASGVRVQLGPSCMFRYAITDDVDEELHRQMYESSSRDLLTRTFNRRYFIERLAAEVAHARRHSDELTLLSLEVDNLREIHDRHGHVLGDVLLRAVAGRVRRLIRLEDVFARMGNEEFAILARSINLEEASFLAERIRRSVAELEVPYDEVVLRTTVTFGIATLSELDAQAGDVELLAAAFGRLARARAEGKERAPK